GSADHRSLRSSPTRRSSDLTSIFVQRFDSAGSAVGSPILLEPAGVTSGNDYNPQITALGSDGAFVVTWYGPDANSGGDTSIFVQDRKSTRLNSSHVKISYAV